MAYSSDPNSNFYFQNAQRVYENLPIFIEGIAKLFPFLNNRWQPILDAANYAERNGW